MAIDPMMYKKYSGRSGDPYAKMGAALAQGDARKARREEARSRTARTWVSPLERFKVAMMGWVIVAITIGFALLVWVVFR